MALRSFLNGALFAETYGLGSPKVLALHGWGRRGRDFAASLDGLSAIAPDLPGFGASPAPKTVIGAHEYADIVAQTLSEFDRPPVLVGHSFGGRVAVCLAAKHPDLIGNVVLAGVPLVRISPASKPSVGYRLVRKLHHLGLVSAEQMEKLKRNRGSADYQAASGVMRDILVKVVNETYEHQLKNIANHVDLVWGDDDREVPQAIAQKASSLLKSSELTILAGVGHLVPTEASAKLRAVIEKRLS